ncbi:3-hydroxymyristoyl-ACP dehydratase [Legionella quinlivanii]|uniref:3-hydroxymyristoyl-ACP dehydratase n=1 Tax=Legionella quinlivanii TaxID=45073 RepID=A0A0W0XYV9_9GAMM|nr:hydroxymyristoyl-ACP dehydratase [Legionella quinlivanii]KTD49647.1 3-hydroxymyristoyl-ACP dehydratase [Legionella quinlivanii]MCW8451988.1 hydroxymyristoyl-ACP dehydratase [Legionella quinlivanii]SEG31061.1 3-hydroxymyristoyl/3-hydroxydecanoyl-(acyl carrier protein) dehydratase [Legionella quinlivanii DSM 21216]STY09815.1 3-hydroxymyristoyl-ACP dehydratase [Legionella quinlivanii]
MRFLFVDRILHLSPGEFIRGVKHITADDGYLQQDETGRFVFPASFIGETLGQLAAWNVMHTQDFANRPVAGVVASASLHRPAYLGETLYLESFIDSLDDTAVQYHSIARVNDDLVFTVDGALGPLLPMSQFIAEQEVREQFAEINRPGDWNAGSQAIDENLFYATRQPIAYPMTFDRVLKEEPGLALTAEKRITRAAPWFPDHFPRNPVLPMTVLLECKIHLARYFIERMGLLNQFKIKELRKIKMNDFVHPGDTVLCQLQLKKQDEEQLVLVFRSEVDGKRVCVLEMVWQRKVN